MSLLNSISLFKERADAWVWKLGWICVQVPSELVISNYRFCYFLKFLEMSCSSKGSYLLMPTSLRYIIILPTKRGLFGKKISSLVVIELLHHMHYVTIFFGLIHWYSSFSVVIYEWYITLLARYTIILIFIRQRLCK